MFKTESLFPAFDITMPSFVLMLYSASDSRLSDKVHQIKIGKSPLLTEHVAVTESSKLNSSSLKENGAIWGKTWKNIEKYSAIKKILR